MAVFVAGLARTIGARAPGSLAARLITIGGAVTVATTYVGYSFALVLAGSADEDRAPSTVAAMYTIADSLGYIGFVPLGLVTAGVALASLADRASPRWLGWISLVAAAVFAALRFLAFLAWAPTLLWLLVAGAGLLVHERLGNEASAEARPA